MFALFGATKAAAGSTRTLAGWTCPPPLPSDTCPTVEATASEASLGQAFADFFAQPPPAVAARVSAVPWVLTLLAALKYGGKTATHPQQCARTTATAAGLLETSRQLVLDHDVDLAIAPRAGGGAWTTAQAHDEVTALMAELLPFLRRRALLNSSHVIGEAATKADWRGCVRRTFSIRINGSGVCASNDAEACRPHTAAKGGPPLRKKNTTKTGRRLAVMRPMACTAPTGVSSLQCHAGCIQAQARWNRTWHENPVCRRRYPMPQLRRRVVYPTLHEHDMPLHMMLLPAT